MVLLTGFDNRFKIGSGIRLCLGKSYIVKGFGDEYDDEYDNI